MPLAAKELAVEPPRGASWTRHAVVPGVELHISAEAEAKLGTAVTSALEAVRSIIEHEGGLDG
jgi:hypothetical protein